MISAAVPPSICSRVAPAASAAHTHIATIGAVGPSGATNAAGFTSVPAGACDRRRSVAAADPPYTTRRASTLTTAIATNEPDTASASATADVNTMAFTGVRNRG